VVALWLGVTDGGFRQDGMLALSATCVQTPLRAVKQVPTVCMLHQTRTKSTLRKAGVVGPMLKRQLCADVDMVLRIRYQRCCMSRCPAVGESGFVAAQSILCLSMPMFCLYLHMQGEARSDLHTLPTAARLDVIRGLFGPELAASLLPLELTGGSGDVSDSIPLDGPMGFVAQVGVSTGRGLKPTPRYQNPNTGGTKQSASWHASQQPLRVSSCHTFRMSS
jgi:hypothetical protein